MRFSLKAEAVASLGFLCHPASMILTHYILPAILAALSLWLLFHFDRLNRGNIDHIRRLHGEQSPLYQWYEKTCGSAHFALANKVIFGLLTVAALGWIAFNLLGNRLP
jgi:hypothetical protein